LIAKTFPFCTAQLPCAAVRANNAPARELVHGP
jgi:hypothetical protein